MFDLLYDHALRDMPHIYMKTAQLEAQQSVQKQQIFIVLAHKYA